MTGYTQPLDIVNRALQHCRKLRIGSMTEISGNAQEVNFVYDKLRQAELRCNTWRFAIRRSILRAVDLSTLAWTPPTYSPTTTYALGAVVVDSNGEWWQSKSAANTGNTPAPGALWQHYFGPDSCDPYVAAASSDPSPAAPALSYTSGGALGAATYYVQQTYIGVDGETIASQEVSLAVPASNLLVIASPAAQSGETSYNNYVSTTQSTETLQNAAPITIGTNWAEPTSGLVFGAQPPSVDTPSFDAGELTSLNGSVYLSLRNNNTDTPPTQNWLLVSGTTTLLQVLYPIGVGPSRDLTSANYFRLPHGFLRQAPSDPKAGINPYLGAPRGPIATDWLFENDYIVSADSGPIMLRFVADVVDVALMDAMYCEMLSARIAEEVAPLLAEKDVLPTVLAVVQRHYKIEREKAVTVNGIETGSVEPPEDDFVTCRY